MSPVPTRGNRTGRAVKVMVFLDQQPKPVLVGDIIAAVDPKCDCALMYGTLSTLYRRKKVVVRKIDGRNHFSLAPGALINQRTGTRLDNPPVPVKKAARARAAARREAKALAAQRQPQTQRTPAAAPLKPLATKPGHEPFIISTSSIHHRVTNAHGGAYMAAKQILSATISSDIAAFEAAGGAIEKLSDGASSRPLNFTYREQAQQLTQLHNAAQKRAKGGFKKSSTTDVDDDADLDD